MVFSRQSSDTFLSTLIFSSSPLIFTTHLSLPSVYSPVVRNYLAPRDGDMAGNPKLWSESLPPVSDSDAKWEIKAPDKAPSCRKHKHFMRSSSRREIITYECQTATAPQHPHRAANHQQMSATQRHQCDHAFTSTVIRVQLLKSMRGWHTRRDGETEECTSERMSVNSIPAHRSLKHHHKLNRPGEQTANKGN